MKSTKFLAIFVALSFVGCLEAGKIALENNSSYYFIRLQESTGPKRALEICPHQLLKEEESKIFSQMDVDTSQIKITIINEKTGTKILNDKPVSHDSIIDSFWTNSAPFHYIVYNVKATITKENTLIVKIAGSGGSDVRTFTFEISGDSLKFKSYAQGGTW